MNKKKWGLLLLAALLLFGYIKLFYKTYSEKAVPQSADFIVAADVKRITNTLLWNFITTPGQWKKISFSSKKTKEISWDDMVRLPDYILTFHVRNQPASVWYALLAIKDKADFEKGLQQFQFEKISNHEYVNKPNSIYLFVQDDKVLVATASVEKKEQVLATADELFTKKTFISAASLKKVINAKSHLAVYLYPADFLQQETVIAANFDKEKIEITGNLEPDTKYNFTENDFKYASNAICAAAFTQLPAAAYNLMNSSYKEKISTALNFNIDSLLQPGNKWYSLNLTEIKTRADSAVTYTYDEEFNKVEKMTVNNIQEPAFDFLITGNSSPAFNNYLLHNEKLEATNAGNLFLPMPFVKSYCNQKNDSQLNITSANYSETAADKSIRAVFILNMVISKIPENLLNYLPEAFKKSVFNLDTLNISAVKKEKQIVLKIIIEKKKNDLPLFSF